MQISQLISQLGGAPALAKKIQERFGEKITSGTVYRWGDRNIISYRWRPFVAILATEAKIELPADLKIFSPTGASPKKGGKTQQLPRDLKNSPAPSKRLSKGSTSSEAAR